MKLLKFDDPALHTACTPVTPEDHLNLQEIYEGMKRVMNDTYDGVKGVGLAAPQVGVLKNIVLVGKTFMVNPVVTWFSPATKAEAEGCLSYPGVRKTVARAVAVRVDYLDMRWKMRKAVMFRDFDARVLQHELDHLRSKCHVGDEWVRLGKPMPKPRPAATISDVVTDIIAISMIAGGV